MRLRSAEDGRCQVAKKWGGDGMESGLCLSHAGVGGGGGAVLAVSSPAKRKRGEPGRFRQVFFLQGAADSRRRRSVAATSGAGRGGEAAAALARVWRDSRGAPGGGGCSPACSRP